MPKAHHPRRGSLAYTPRKRAKRIYPRVRSRVKTKEIKITEFAGYKVGMTHISVIDDVKGSVTQNQEITLPVTVLETPPLKVVGLRIYGKSTEGLKPLRDFWISETDKAMEKKVHIPKKRKTKIEELKKEMQNISEISMIVHTMPGKTIIGKKKPELFEILVCGENTEEKFKLAEEKLGNELRINDIFNAGDFIDTTGITKGKGFQGVVKRFGVKTGKRKYEKKRMVGNLGPWTPKKISWRVPRDGQMGYHTRTDINKRILKIGENPEEIAVKGDWLNYGKIKNPYILIKGSIPGPAKRLIRIRSAIRPPGKETGTPVIEHVSLESKQGV